VVIGQYLVEFLPLQSIPRSSLLAFSFSAIRENLFEQGMTNTVVDMEEPSEKRAENTFVPTVDKRVTWPVKL